MHIDMPTRHDIERIAASTDPLSVSIYLPTSTNPADDEQNRLTGRALFDKAIAEVDAQTDKRTARAFSESLLGLLDDDEFWADLGRSLAVFATPDGIVEFRLPNELTEFVSVSDRFTITPLLRAITFPNAAFVLGLSQNGVRLVEVSADRPAEELSVPGLPRNAERLFGLRSIGGRSPYGRIQGDEGRKVRLTQYARAVDHALRPVLNGQSLPLILAATQPLDGIYRGVNGYVGLAEESIDGNPDEMSAGELADAARPILDAQYRADIENLAALFADRRNSGRATTDLADLARAGVAGALDTLIVDMDAEVPGSIGADGALEAADPGGRDLLEDLAHIALGTGTRVLAVRGPDVPEGASCAGILRYAI